MTDLILAKAKRLCLLRELDSAKRSHKPTKRLRADLKRVTAQVAALEVRNG